VASSDDILAFCRLNMGEEEAEQLVGWLAWRTERNGALAGAGAPVERLAHALENWLDDERRERLLAWLERRRDRGDPLVPA
jgi:hypothetical protein